MKGREKKGHASTDFLVCFPSRAHLTLMPKRICSPVQLSDPSTSHHQHSPRHPHHHHQQPNQHHLLRKSSTSRHASSLLLANAYNKSSKSDISEPTSPKVTCAGQIKVRPKPNSCKNWQSVMKEIERLHSKSKQQKKKSTWIEALGFKKDAMQFLTCLRNIRFDFRCFGSFPAAEISSEDEDDDDDDPDEEENKEESDDINDQGSRTVFSKWFMILPEDQGEDFRPEIEINNNKGKMVRSCLDEDEEYGDNSSVPPPPPNALLLMRCRSAPAKSWLEEKDEKNEKEKERLSVMTCGDEFSKLPADIAKETWINNMISRSRSSKR